MQAYNLDKMLEGHTFSFLMCFCRLGSAVMLLPGFGESYVPPRVRMMFALALCFLLMEPLRGHMPPPPQTISGLAHLASYEVIIGLFYGVLLRILISTLETAGMVISIQSGLSNATVLNPALANQSPLPSALLSVLGVVVIFATGLDHLMFRSLLALYDIFPPGGELMPGDMSQVVIQAVNKSFLVGVELAMPFFVMGLLMYIAVGLLQKLMPQVQLFLVVQPVQIWGGLTLMAVTLTGMLAAWLAYADKTIGSFVER